jgi:hypothetical protein
MQATLQNFAPLSMRKVFKSMHQITAAIGRSAITNETARPGRSGAKCNVSGDQTSILVRLS